MNRRRFFRNMLAGAVAAASASTASFLAMRWMRGRQLTVAPEPVAARSGLQFVRVMRWMGGAGFWSECDFEDLRPGDRFRTYDPKDGRLLDEGVACSYAIPCDPPGNWGISMERRPA